MHVTRRNLAVAGVLALGTSSLLHSAAVVAESSDEAAVNQAVEALRKALLEGDKARLEQLAADQMSYGHSGGRIENKAQFVDALVSRKSIITKVDLSKVNTSIVGDLAIVRGHMLLMVESTGKPVPTDLEFLMVWQKRGSEWKLLARQAFKV